MIFHKNLFSIFSKSWGFQKNFFFRLSLFLGRDGLNDFFTHFGINLSWIPKNKFHWQPNTSTSSGYKTTFDLISLDESFDWRNWKIRWTIVGPAGQEEDRIFVDKKKDLQGWAFFADDGGECGRKILFSARPRNTPKTDLSALLTILATLNTR